MDSFRQCILFRAVLLMVTIVLCEVLLLMNAIVKRDSDFTVRSQGVCVGDNV